MAFFMSQMSPGDKARQQIDANLKRVFQEQSQEELPDRLKDLLSKLKEQENKTDSGSTS